MKCSMELNVKASLEFEHTHYHVATQRVNLYAVVTPQIKQSLLHVWISKPPQTRVGLDCMPIFKQSLIALTLEFSFS